MATVNQMIPRSGQPKRFSFHIETNANTTRVSPRNTISHRLKATIVRWVCTRSISSWTASVILLAVGLAAAWRVLGLAALPYQLCWVLAL